MSWVDLNKEKINVVQLHLQTGVIAPCNPTTTMKIILTHEQTDFDGLASLLGAHLLDETAIPVLPRRMNRNVRAFLTIYGVDLPFVDPRIYKTKQSMR